MHRVAKSFAGVRKTGYTENFEDVVLEVRNLPHVYDVVHDSLGEFSAHGNLA
jgi:hypothetical protein